MNESIQIDDLVFEVRRSARRTTIGLTVERDGSLVVAAPARCPRADMERAASKKLPWVYAKLAQRRLTSPSTSDKEFVSGEGFYYLGRSYRLKLIDPESYEWSQSPLRLHNGRFLLRRDQAHEGKQHFVRWYVEHGEPWLGRRLRVLAARLGVEHADVKVRELGYRWGSYRRGHALNLHWRTVLLPSRYAEYVVAHELTHVCEANHGHGFWERLERILPDYRVRKQWLADNGARFSL